VPPIVTSAEINRPAGEVFAYATDPARSGTPVSWPLGQSPEDVSNPRLHRALIAK
jgi:hypothetical protein